jgi:iron(III) transport system substrate-binding protein
MLRHQALYAFFLARFARWLAYAVVGLLLLSLTACNLPRVTVPEGLPAVPFLSNDSTALGDQFISLTDLSREEIAAYRKDENTVIIYSALSAEQMRQYLGAFGRAYPNIRVVWYRDSTGVVVRRLLDEVDNPVADVIWGLAVTNMLQVDAAGLLEPYSPSGLSLVNETMRDSLTPPYWVGIDVYASALCVNMQMLADLGLPMPFAWRDLTSSVYRNPETGIGYIAMPNPRDSGTGYMAVSGLMQILGSEEAAWEYMDALHQNIGEYTVSGRDPCRRVGAGIYPIGISFSSASIEQRVDFGRPVLTIFPDEGVGWEVEANALVRKPETKQVARTFLDWAISPAAMREYAQYYPVTSVPVESDFQLPEGYPEDMTVHFIPDPRFMWGTANYERITLEWLKRYSEQSDLSNNELEMRQVPFSLTPQALQNPPSESDPAPTATPSP